MVQIAEALAVTTYTNIIDNAPFFKRLESDDQGYLMVAVQVPDGASLERTQKVMDEISKIGLAVPGADHAIAIGTGGPSPLAGDVSLGLSKLTSITGLSLSDVPLAQAVLTADKRGLTIHGSASGVVGRL